MSLRTAFLNLFKPESGDKFSITGTEGYNKNMDLIDEAVKKNANAIIRLNSDVDFKSDIIRSSSNENGNINRIKISVPVVPRISCSGILFQRYGVIAFFMQTDKNGYLDEAKSNILVGYTATIATSGNTCMITTNEWNHYSVLISTNNIGFAKEIVISYDHD